MARPRALPNRLVRCAGRYPGRPVFPYGAKMYPLLRHGGNHLGERGSVCHPPLYGAGATMSVMMSLIMLLPRMYACRSR